MPTMVADQLADTLEATGVKRVYSIVGNGSSGMDDAMGRHGKIMWLHVHEKVAAFATALQLPR